MTTAPEYQMLESERMHNIDFSGWEIISHMRMLGRCRAGDGHTQPEWVPMYEGIVRNIQDSIRFNLRRISRQRVVELLESDRAEVRRLAAEVLCEDPPRDAPTLVRVVGLLESKCREAKADCNGDKDDKRWAEPSYAYLARLAN